jgi:hypothetical protein
MISKTTNETLQTIHLINQLHDWTNLALIKIMEGDEPQAARMLVKILETIEDPSVSMKIRNLLSDLGVPF